MIDKRHFNNFNNEEVLLVFKLIEVSEENNLFGSEEELFKKLRG